MDDGAGFFPGRLAVGNNPDWLPTPFE